MAQHTHPHPAPCGKVQIRFEPGHLASACLADAYLRLAPVAWRPLSRSPRGHTPCAITPEIADRQWYEHAEEARQCL
jgi:hypothetical protein